jgi:hypothetical protein
MELLAGGLAASGACLLTNPLEVTQLCSTAYLANRSFGGTRNFVVTVAGLRLMTSSVGDL